MLTQINYNFYFGSFKLRVLIKKLFIKTIFFLLIGLLVFSCKSDTHQNEEVFIPEFKRDLREIIKDKKLRVSTTYSGTNYFLYKGRAMGFQYELLERFAKYLDVEIEIIVANDINNLIPNLNSGKVDLIAHELTITQERKNQVSFSDYIYLTHQVLIQRKPDNWRQMKLHEIDRFLIKDVIELDNKTISVRAETSYMQRLKNLNSEIGGQIKIDTIDGKYTTNDVIKMVVDGEVEYTVADNNIASIMASYYPILDISVPVSFSQQIAWATRTNSPELLEELNSCLSKFKRTIDYHEIYRKYFENKRDFRRRSKSDYFSLNSNTISEYDEIIKDRADFLGWDWRLLSAMIFQESQFDIRAKSWAGAGGLMQLMPITAEEMGVKDRYNARDNLTGGTKYLKILFDRFEEIDNFEQRVKFTLASYNCGYEHVKDAQRLAEKRGLNSMIWDENVDEMIVALSRPKNYNDKVVRFGYVRGIEPFNYVKQIFENYTRYQDFIKEE